MEGDVHSRTTSHGIRGVANRGKLLPGGTTTNKVVVHTVGVGDDPHADGGRPSLSPLFVVEGTSSYDARRRGNKVNTCPLNTVN